jgi:hypothetical protein
MSGVAALRAKLEASGAAPGGFRSPSSGGQHASPGVRREREEDGPADVASPNPNRSDTGGAEEQGSSRLVAATRPRGPSGRRLPSSNSVRTRRVREAETPEETAPAEEEEAHVVEVEASSHSASSSSAGPIMVPGTRVAVDDTTWGEYLLSFLPAVVRQYVPASEDSNCAVM